MKFLCDHCKAKYQIPDEKVAGRTLRMTCRRCKNDIIIRGEGASSQSIAQGKPLRGPASVAGSSSVERPTRSKGGSSVGPAPGRGQGEPAPRPSAHAGGSAQAKGSALGAGFRQHVADERQPSRPPVQEEWFVAINDVPVGPIHRDEIARKVGTGAVTEETLAWREGLDDWRPVREIPALLALLRQRRVPAPPPRPAPRPVPPPSRSNVIPIGGRLGAAPAASPDDFNEESTQIAQAPEFAAMMAPPAPAPIPVATPVAGPSAAPLSAAPLSAAPLSAAPLSAANNFSVPPGSDAVYARRGPGIPPTAWIGIVGALAFGVTLAIMVATKMAASPPQPIATADPAPTQPETPQQPALDLDPTPDPNTAVAALDNPEPATPDTETGRTPSEGATAARKNTGSTGATHTTKQLTAEEQALVDRFGGSSDVAPTTLRVADTNTSGATAHGPLDAAQVRRVVTQNRPALQRCYDRAIRGRTDPPSVRMDVALTVSSAGHVTAASANGSDFGGLGSCLETSVRHWRFPASADGGQTAFPVVFSSGN